MQCSNLIIVAFLVVGCYGQFGGEYPASCNVQAARQCEHEFYLCRLYTGPANDPATMCRCGKDFYGNCLRQAGCMLHFQTFYEPYMVYMKQCINLIMQYDCPDTTICAINCASSGNIDKSISKILPFNNYGPHYLRLRLCNHTVHPQKLTRYGIVYPATCSAMEEFQICSRWIAPSSFVPVAIPINTTYMMVDYCDIDSEGNKRCRTSDPSPSRVYGNKVIFPSTFDVTKTASSICSTNGRP